MRGQQPHTNLPWGYLASYRFWPLRTTLHRGQRASWDPQARVLRMVSLRNTGTPLVQSNGGGAYVFDTETGLEMQRQPLAGLYQEGPVKLVNMLAGQLGDLGVGTLAAPVQGMAKDRVPLRGDSFSLEDTAWGSPF